MVAVDRYYSQDSVSSPARRMFVVTPHDSNEITPLPKAIRFNAAGTVVLRGVDDTADVTIAVVAGEVLDLRARFIRATGTTVAAGSIHALG